LSAFIDAVIDLIPLTLALIGFAVIGELAKKYG
jgi:hypothetical protein